MELSLPKIGLKGNRLALWDWTFEWVIGTAREWKRNLSHNMSL